MQLSEYMNIETSAFGTAQKNLNQYSIRRVARPLTFDIYNTCKPSCTFLFRTLYFTAYFTNNLPCACFSGL